MRTFHQKLTGVTICGAFALLGWAAGYAGYQLDRWTHSRLVPAMVLCLVLAVIITTALLRRLWLLLWVLLVAGALFIGHPLPDLVALPVVTGQVASIVSVLALSIVGFFAVRARIAMILHEAEVPERVRQGLAWSVVSLLVPALLLAVGLALVQLMRWFWPREIGMAITGFGPLVLLVLYVRRGTFFELVRIMQTISGPPLAVVYGSLVLALASTWHSDVHYYGLSNATINEVTEAIVEASLSLPASWAWLLATLAPSCLSLAALRRAAPALSIRETNRSEFEQLADQLGLFGDEEGPTP